MVRETERGWVMSITVSSAASRRHISQLNLRFSAVYEKLFPYVSRFLLIMNIYLLSQAIRASYCSNSSHSGSSIEKTECCIKMLFSSRRAGEVVLLCIDSCCLSILAITKQHYNLRLSNERIV